MRRFTIAVVLMLAGRLTAQSAKSASVEGDVYLTLRNGQLSKVAASTVTLVRADSIAAARRICGDGASVSDRKRLDSLDAAFASVLVRGTVRSSKTGMQAHYKIDSIEPGAYTLWAETRLGISYSWFVPIVVTAGQTQTVDLDNSNVTPGIFYCLKV